MKVLTSEENFLILGSSYGIHKLLEYICRSTTNKILLGTSLMALVRLSVIESVRKSLKGEDLFDVVLTPLIERSSENHVNIEVGVLNLVSSLACENDMRNELGIKNITNLLVKNFEMVFVY